METQVETLTGIVERLTYHSQESGYTVAKVKIARMKDLVTVVGNFAAISPGQTLKITGYWREHPQYGPQFQAKSYQETKPATLTGIEKYLGSGLIKGVGPITAKRIVAHFGLDTLPVIENEIERLSEVKGIAKKRIKQIQGAWQEQKAIQEVMLFLQSHGVSTTYAVKIYKQYGEKAIATVTNNPYQLAKDIFGIGFLTADQIARNLGIANDSPFRYQAGIFYVLAEAAEAGHCFLPEPELINNAQEKLKTEDHQPGKEALQEVIAQMAKSQDLVVEEVGKVSLCYKPTFFHTEKNLAQLIKEHQNKPVTIDLPRVRHWLTRFTKSRKLQLSPQQQQAVETAAGAKVIILTGGPGTGKTFTTKTIVALWKAMGKTIGLAAPTGRAAQRLGAMTATEAKTLHRLLEFDPATMGFKRDKHNHLPYDAVVVDEASMLDLFLAYGLIQAIPPEGQLLLVGDVDQLPSVGPGSILQDLIKTEREKIIPVVRLNQVFRQASQSAIIRTAHQINQGRYPQLEAISPTPVGDCLWHNGGYEPEHGVQVIGELITGLIPQFGFHPLSDVQVLCPMIRGMVGTRNLNQVLQKLLNPPCAEKGEITRGGTTLRVGDRIIQQKNDYQREVFNGDEGVIKAIDSEEKEVSVEFANRLVTYDYADLNEIALAWAITIHKSQGSEYPVVIVPLYTQHYLMLSRNLLYTALTRAKKLAILIGSKKVIALAIKQVKDNQRYTRLSARLLSCNTIQD